MALHNQGIERHMAMQPSCFPLLCFLNILYQPRELA